MDVEKLEKQQFIRVHDEECLWGHGQKQKLTEFANLLANYLNNLERLVFESASFFMTFVTAISKSC